MYKRNVRLIAVFFYALILTACGGGGGGSSTPAPQVTPPVTPNPVSSSLYIGYYTESNVADTNDPTPGVLYMYLPDTDTTFNGQFYFSYVGCIGSFDTGQVVGALTGANTPAAAINGTWSGDVDGTTNSGTFTANNTGGSSLSGTWTNNAGTVTYSFGSAPNQCGYTFAGNGAFIIYKVANGSIPLSVDLSSPFTPTFSFALNSGAAVMKFNVFDKACLIGGGGVSACLMWENIVPDTGSGLPSATTYAIGGTPAQNLVSGNTYIATVMSYDTSGSVLDFGSAEFVVP